MFINYRLIFFSLKNTPKAQIRLKRLKICIMVMPNMVQYIKVPDYFLFLVHILVVHYIVLRNDTGTNTQDVVSFAKLMNSSVFS
jgi:hypothetical protein